MRTEHDLDQMLANYEPNPVLEELSTNGHRPDFTWRLTTRRGTRPTPEEVVRRRRIVRALLLQDYSCHEIGKMVNAAAAVVEEDAIAMGMGRGRTGANAKVGARARKIRTEAEEFAALYRGDESTPGKTIPEIAKIYGINRRKVQHRLNWLGIDTSKNWREGLEEMAADYEAGMTFAQVGEKYGFHETTVRGRLVRAGYAIRDGHEVRQAPKNRVKAKDVTASSLVEMAKFADLVQIQDLDSVTLTEEEAEAWEAACRKVGRAIAKVRRDMKGKQ